MLSYADGYKNAYIVMTDPNLSIRSNVVFCYEYRVRRFLEDDEESLVWSVDEVCASACAADMMQIQLPETPASIKEALAGPNEAQRRPAIN